MCSKFSTQLVRTAVQLLSNLLRHRGPEVQSAVMQQPMGLSKLVDIVHDNREVIRNEAILMICELSRANSQIQQLLAYDNIFNDLLNIIETEPLESMFFLEVRGRVFAYYRYCYRRLSVCYSQLTSQKLDQPAAVQRKPVRSFQFENSNYSGFLDWYPESAIYCTSSCTAMKTQKKLRLTRRSGRSSGLPTSSSFSKSFAHWLVRTTRVRTHTRRRKLSTKLVSNEMK